jgi:purine-binding chemotaxis protein CheW
MTVTSCRVQGHAASSASQAEVVLTFSVDDDRCAIDAAAVEELVRAVAVRPLPGQPAFIAGVIDLRGSVIPVLDVRVRLGRSRREMATSDQFIIASIHGRRVALWVDQVDELVTCDVDTLTASTGLVVGMPALRGVSRTRSGLVMIYDVEAFISQSEADALVQTVDSS